MFVFLLKYSDTIFPFLCFCFFLGMKQKVWQQKMLLLYFIVTTFLMGWTNYLADRSINNSFIYHGYTLFEVLLVVPLIGSYNPNSKQLVTASIYFYSLFWLINILCLEPHDTFNSNSAGIGSLLILFFCLRYFLLIIKTERLLHFQKLPSLWVTFGFLFYSATSILMLSSYKFLHNYLDIGIVEVWKIIEILNIIKFTVFIIAGLCFYRQTSLEPLS